MNTDMPKSKINLFALPSQTTLFFWLLTATLLGAVLFGSLVSANPIPLEWLPLLLVLLSLRSFLAHPDREIRQAGLLPIDERFPLLQNAVENNAKHIGLKRTPQILINKNRNEIYIMGSFRHWYIVCGLEQASALENQLTQSPQVAIVAHAKILHELYHFKTGDYWQLGYLAELFKTAFYLILWVLVFFSGFIILMSFSKIAILQMSPDFLLQNVPPEFKPFLTQMLFTIFPQHTQLEAIDRIATEINFSALLWFIANLSTPIIFLVAILWWFYRPLLWQMREFYADAGMVQSLGTTAPFLDMLNANRTSVLPRQAIGFVETFINISKRLDAAIRKANFWPKFADRLNALSFPQKVFYDWKQTAWLLGSLIVVLELFLSAPFTIPYTENLIYFTTLTIIISTSYFLLPYILMGKSSLMKGLLIIAVVNFIRMLWLVFSLAYAWGFYLLDPNMFSKILISGIYAGTRDTSLTSPLAGINLFDAFVNASFANLAPIPFIFAIQALSILGLMLLIRRLCGWYAFLKTSQLFKRIILFLNLWLSFILCTTLLPWSNAFLLGRLTLLWEPVNIFLTTLGILVGLGGAIWFFVQDQRYNHKCPNCQTKVVQSNLIDASCPSCKTILYPWLVAYYEDV